MKHKGLRLFLLWLFTSLLFSGAYLFFRSMYTNLPVPVEGQYRFFSVSFIDIKWWYFLFIAFWQGIWTLILWGGFKKVSFEDFRYVLVVGATASTLAFTFTFLNLEARDIFVTALGYTIYTSLYLGLMGGLFLSLKESFCGVIGLAGAITIVLHPYMAPVAFIVTLLSVFVGMLVRFLFRPIYQLIKRGLIVVFNLIADEPNGNSPA